MVLTKKDIEKLTEVFVVKNEFNGKFSNLKSELKDQILTSEDRIMKKLEDIEIN